MLERTGELGVGRRSSGRFCILVTEHASFAINITFLEF